MHKALERERVLIRGLKLYGRHGVRVEEQERGQLFTVDVWLDLERPSAEDDLAATVDYTEVVRVIRELNEAHRYRLLESFARAVAEVLIERFEPLQRARVRVWKRLIRPGLDVDGVAAEVGCRRGEGASCDE